jgi:hypothetical protein
MVCKQNFKALKAIFGGAIAQLSRVLQNLVVTIGKDSGGKFDDYSAAIGS